MPKGRKIGVHREIHHAALGHGDDAEFGIGLEGAELIGRQVPGDVDIALTQHEQLHGGVGHMQDDDAAGLRLGPVRRVRVGVGVKDEPIGPGPGGDAIGAGAGGAGFQPGVAEVSVDRIRHGAGAFNDGTNGAAQAAQEEIGRDRGGQFDDHARRAVSADLAVDGFGRKSELGDDECRRLVQGHDAAQRKDDVIGGDGSAGGEAGVGAEGEGEDPSVGADGPAAREVRHECGGVGRVGPDEAAVAIGQDLDAGEFIGFGRIEAREIVDDAGHDDHPGRRAGPGRGGACEGRRHEEAGEGSAVDHGMPSARADM